MVIPYTVGCGHFLLSIMIFTRCTWRVQAQPGQKINITLLDFTVGVPGEPAHTMCLVSTAIVNPLKMRNLSDERFYTYEFLYFYSHSPSTKLREDNVFTCVCLSVKRGEQGWGKSPKSWPSTASYNESWVMIIWRSPSSTDIWLLSKRTPLSSGWYASYWNPAIIPSLPCRCMRWSGSLVRVLRWQCAGEEDPGTDRCTCPRRTAWTCWCSLTWCPNRESASFSSTKVSDIRVFCDFSFKIRLIRLGFLSKKSKIPVFELTTYWFPARSHYRANCEWETHKRSQ